MPDLEGAGPRVLFSHDIFAIQRYGGVSRYVVQLHESLREAGVDSRVFGGLHVNEYLDGLGSVTGRRITTPPVAPARHAVRLLNVVAERRAVERWKPAAYHLTYYSRRRPRLRVPLVVTVYDMIHELFPEQFSPQDRTTEHKRWWVQAADIVFALSERTKADLLELWPWCEPKVVVVRPGLMPMGTLADDRNPYGEYLLFVGNRGPRYKNFRRFIDAVAVSEHGRQCGVVCFGGGDFSDGERRQLADVGLLAQLHAVSGTDSVLATLLRHARALVYPSTYEGFGFPVLEAMSVGCPVVCSDAGPLPEVVGPAAVLFDPDDVDGMAVAIDRVLGDSELAASLRARGTAQARTFDWRVAGREARPYYELLARSGGGA